MSRTTPINEEIEKFHDNKIKSVLTDFSVKESKIVIMDADSLLYFAAYTGKDEFGNKNPEYTEEQYEIAEGVINESIIKILTKIEEYFDIEKFYICVKGKNKNFRKNLLPEYKANRPLALPIIDHLLNYIIEHHKAIPTPYGEADDLVYTMSKAINHTGIIVHIDGDLLQMPSIFYNFKKDSWCKINEKEAKLHLALKILTGDDGDNVKVNYGLGPKKAAKLVNKEMSDYQYIKTIYQTYSKYNGTEAKNVLKRTYNLLRLHDLQLNT